jgi:adenosylmethionine-8-amino-7-oxononanoate aminotransferase
VPLGGVLVGAAVREPMETDAGFWLRHGFTYSGHAGAAAAGHAVLDILEREALLDRARHVGKRLEDGLRSLQRDGLVVEVRGEVAVWAVALPDGQDPVQVRDHALAGGMITRAVGADTLTFCPPLVTTDDQIDRIVDTLAASLLATRPD